MRVLVTGGTGYVGGRLIPRLLERGHEIRVLSRDPRRLSGRRWAHQVERVAADLQDAASLPEALRGIDVAYYLVHAMSDSADFAAKDRAAAKHFGEAARAAGVKHVIYLGGLLPTGVVRSPHLRSRAEVGRILAEHVPTTELRAGPIIGSGSASFEMTRYLTERLPVMVAPKWIRNQVDPIAIRDVLSYLLLALERQPGGVIPIGGDRLTFKQMMLRYAEVRGLRRVIVPVPVLAPSLAARWVGLVTPIPNRLAVPLIEGVVQPLRCDDQRAREVFPEVEPIPYRRAVELALEKMQRADVETRWSGALGESQAVELHDWEGIIREVRTVPTAATPEQLFATFTSLGGERGYLVWDRAWAARGLMDRLIGGPGLRRGRRHPTEIYLGEAIDFWRVEAIEPPTLLRMRAEMKTPGHAWLQFEAKQRDGRTWLVQTALFEPHGLPGWLYWYVLYPIHRVIFTQMARAVAREAEAMPPAGDMR